MPADLVQQIESFKKAREELKSATRDARSVLKGLNEERRAIEALHKSIPETVDKQAIDFIAEATGPKLSSFATELGEHQSLMFDTIMKAFTDMLHILIEGDKAGRGDSVIRAVEKKMLIQTEEAKAKRRSWLDG